MLPKDSKACPHCLTPFQEKKGQIPHFCPECHKAIPPKKQLLDELPLPKSIGNYQIERWIGRGGMGEVFLAYDPECQRYVAIKRIRTDIELKPVYKTRFLREAYLTAQLSHPSIVPIFSIHEEADQIYYVMPFVQGKTFKMVLHEALIDQKNGTDSVESKIPYLVRIFLNVCQAVAYAHSKGVLHRDLKPENVMIGEYGHVLILDWGLIKRIDDKDHPQDTIEEEEENHQGTLKKKVIGTLAYLAPERAVGTKATIASEIYALGVILYQILTLQLPFHRPSVSWLIKNRDKEELQSPVEAAPYRDVPDELEYIVMKCLEKKSTKRFHSVDDLIIWLENYLEGRTSWLLAKELQLDQKNDWEFQENVLIPEYLAISSKTIETNWVTLMVSAKSFSGNTKIESRFRLHAHSKGIGFLFAVPESAYRQEPTDGYCLWLSTTKTLPSKLISSAVDVMELPDITLKMDHWYEIRLEKINHTIHLFIDHQLVMTYISHLPLKGTHVGLLFRDADFTIDHYRVYIGSPNILISCLAVPDAFLSRRFYKAALSEYRRIGYTFIGRAESREALFRAGITLLEQAKHENKPSLYDSALKEFEMLKDTAAAPLEYLGKSLVYQTLKDIEEEAKCLEFAICKYEHHPLIHLIHQQLFFRLHESSRKERLAAYRFALIALYHLEKYLNEEHRKLLLRLKKEWEQLPFFTTLHSNESNFEMIIPLAFWLDKQSLLESIVQDLSDKKHSQAKENALYALLFMTHDPTLEKCLKANPKYFKPSLRAVIYQLEKAWENSDYLSMEVIALKKKMNYYLAIAYLGQKKIEEAKKIIHEHLSHEYSPLSCWHILYGLTLAASHGEEEAISYFKSLLLPPYPPSCALIATYLTKSMHERMAWTTQSFTWEKRALNKQLKLYYYLIGVKDVLQISANSKNTK